MYLGYLVRKVCFCVAIQKKVLNFSLCHRHILWVEKGKLNTVFKLLYSLFLVQYSILILFNIRY